MPHGLLTPTACTTSLRRLLAAGLLVTLAGCSSLVVVERRLDDRQSLQSEFVPVEVVELDPLPLLSRTEEAQLVGQPGITVDDLAIENQGLGAGRLTGWVFRLQPDSVAARVHWSLVNPSVDVGLVDPDTRVELPAPWTIAAGELRGVVFAVRPLAPGALAGRFELLDGDEVVLVVRVRGQAAPPKSDSSAAPPDER